MPETQEPQEPQIATESEAPAPQVAADGSVVLEEAPIVTMRNRIRDGIASFYERVVTGARTSRKVWRALSRSEDPGDAPESPLWKKPFHVAGNVADGTLLTPPRSAERIGTPALGIVDKIIRKVTHAGSILAYPVTHPFNTLKTVTVIGAGDAIKDLWKSTKGVASNAVAAVGKTIKTAAAIVSEPVEIINDVVSRSVTRASQVVLPNPLTKVAAIPRWFTRKAVAFQDWIKSRPSAWLASSKKKLEEITAGDESGLQAA